MGQDGAIEHTPLIVTREAVPADFDRYFDEGFAALGPESRVMRFFTPVHDLPEGVRQRLRDVDGYVNAAIIAFDAALLADDHPEGRPVGVARWMGVPLERKGAERGAGFVTARADLGPAIEAADATRPFVFR